MNPSKARRRADDPKLTGLIMLFVGVLFVVCRLGFAADGDVSEFIGAGDKFVDSNEVPEHIHVFENEGYDGQFSYRMTLDPTALDTSEHLGISLDNPLRVQRIVYPLLGWVGSGTGYASTDEALVVINILGLGVIGFLSGALARHFGRHAAWGLLIGGFWGFFFTLARDLTEITAAVFILSGILAFLRRRHVLAGVAFATAVLTRESAVWLVAGMAVPEMLASLRASLVRHRIELSRRMLSFVLPTVAFCAWQLWCWHVTGGIPLRSGGNANLRIPFTDLAPSALDWLGDVFGPKPLASLLIVVQGLALILVVVLAARRLRLPGIDRSLKGAWVACALLVVSLSRSVWVGPADFRTAVELYLVSALLLVSDRRPLTVPTAVVFLTSGATALVRIFVF